MSHFNKFQSLSGAYYDRMGRRKERVSTMWKKVLSVLLSALMAALVCAGCKPDTTGITLAVDSIPVSADPVISDSTAMSTIAANCYEGLVRIDENGNVQAGAADHWSISDDGLTYTFILRDGLTWHVPDAESAETASKNPLGEEFIRNFPTAMTADDFVFGLQRAVSKNTNAPGASRLFGIQNAEAIYNGKLPTRKLGVSAPNESSVRIKLSAPDSNFLYALASPCSMPCSRAFFEATAGRYGLTPQLMLCNGPYYLSSMIAGGTTAVMAKNENYQGPFPGSVDTCTLRLARETLMEDESDPLEITTDFAADDGVLDGAILSAAGASALPALFDVTGYENIVHALVFNMGSDFSGNEDLRLALATATDVSALLENGTEAAEGLIPDCCHSVSGTVYRLAAGKAKGCPFNLKKAKKYYAAALEKFEAAATKDEPAPTSFAIKFLCLQEDKALAQSIVQNWQKVFGTSLSITIESVESPEPLQRALIAGDYDVAFTPLKCTELVAAGFLRQFSGDTDANIVHLASDEYDELLRGAASSTDSGDITRYCLAAEQYLMKQGIVLPVSQQATALAVKKKTADGLRVLPTGDTYLIYNVKA